MMHLQSQTCMRRAGELNRGDNPSEQTSVWLGRPSADVREKGQGWEYCDHLSQDALHALRGLWLQWSKGLTAFLDFLFRAVQWRTRWEFQDPFLYFTRMEKHSRWFPAEIPSSCHRVMRWRGLSISNISSHFVRRGAGNSSVLSALFFNFKSPWISFPLRDKFVAEKLGFLCGGCWLPTACQGWGTAITPGRSNPQARRSLCSWLLGNQNHCAFSLQWKALNGPLQPKGGNKDSLLRALLTHADCLNFL